MTTFRVAVGDNYVQTLHLMIQGESGYVDLTSATMVQVEFTDVDTGVLAATVNCTIVTVATAEISFTIGPPLTNTRAMYTANFRLYGIGDTVMSCPLLLQQGLWVY